MQQRETRLREEQQSKEAEIGRLREELRKCQALLQEGARQVRSTTDTKVVLHTHAYHMGNED